jgi:hypothetical protein
VEIAFVSGNVMPELSFGTHFFQDLVETGISYVALFPDNEDVIMNHKFFDSMPRSLKYFAPQHKKYENVIKVFDAPAEGLKIATDVVSQSVICYFK